MTELASEAPGPGVLERARVNAALSFYELWIRYIGLGGSFGPADVERFLRGTTDPSRHDYNLLVDSLNERFEELSLDRSVLYAA